MLWAKVDSVLDGLKSEGRINGDNVFTLRCWNSRENTRWSPPRVEDVIYHHSSDRGIWLAIGLFAWWIPTIALVFNTFVLCKMLLKPYLHVTYHKWTSRVEGGGRWLGLSGIPVAGWPPVNRDLLTGALWPSYPNNPRGGPLDILYLGGGGGGGVLSLF